MGEVTSGKQWMQRKDEGVEIVFPSGNRARIRAISPIDFLELGEIPDVMRKTVEEVLVGKTEAPGTDSQGTLDSLKEYYDFLVFYAKRCFVSPRIVDHPQNDDEMTISALDTEDLEFLSSVIFAPMSALRRFSEGQAERVEPVQPGKGDVPGAKRDHARRGVGTGRAPVQR